MGGEVMEMVVFFGKLFVVWVVVYSVLTLKRQVKERKEQENFNKATAKYFKGE